MRFLSLFSGIEAFSVATRPLGWKCVAVAEIEPFPCKVLNHHYPDVPNLGDITKITSDQIQALGHIDVVVFGAPCTDLSVAGKRKGMFNDDGSPTRSGLFFAAVRICEWSGARFSLYENVPGMYSSSQGRDFAAVVGEMAGCEFDIPKGGWQNSGVALGPLGLIEWITLDAQYIRTRQFPRAVPQRRRRVFVVRDSGNWSSRPPLFLKPESLLGNPPPIRKTRKDIATDATCGVAGTVGARTGLSIGAQDAMNGHLLPVTFDRQSNCEYGDADIASTMSARDYKSPSDLVTYANAGNIIGRSEGNGANGTGFSADGESYTLTKTDVHAVCYPINTQNTLHRPDGHSHAVAFGVASSPDRKQCARSGASKADKPESTTYIAVGHVDYENNGYEMNCAAGALLKGSQSGGGRPQIATAYSFDSMSSNPHSGVNTVDVAKTLDTSALNPSAQPCICTMINMGDECPICGLTTNTYTFTLQGITQGELYGRTKETDTVTLLRRVRDEVGEETFTKWGFGILDSLQSPQILQSALHGKEFRQATFSRRWVVYCTLSRSEDRSAGVMQSLWEASGERCAPQRWRSLEQFAGKLGTYLSELSRPGAQAERFMQDLWFAAEGFGVLRETLSKIQKIRRPNDGENKSASSRFQIRRLTPECCEFLQGFPRGYTNIPGASDTTRYRALGNSMATNVMNYIATQIDTAVNYDILRL